MSNPGTTSASGWASKHFALSPALLYPKLQFPQLWVFLKKIFTRESGLVNQRAQNPSPQESKAVPGGGKPFVRDSQQEQWWDFSKIIRILVQVSYGFHLEAGLTRPGGGSPGWYWRDKTSETYRIPSGL